MEKLTLLTRFSEKVINVPLMILPDKLSVILSVIGERIGIDQKIELIETGLKTNGQAPRSSDSNTIPENVSVIPIHGSLVHRTHGLDAMSGLTSYEAIRKDFRAALESDTEAILFDINSPGGEAHGLMDFVDEIYEARGDKPIYAVANESAYSAAYAIASAADKIFLSRSAGVGSVGVIAIHRDQSKFDADMGMKYTPVYAGARKNDLSPHHPLTSEAKQFLEEEVNRHYEMFVDAVARNRGLPVSKVRQTEAGLFTGESAVSVGFADEIRPFTSVLAGIASGDVGLSYSVSVPVIAAYSHNSQTKEGEPEWGSYIAKNRKSLPDSAFADMENRKYPHHWISDGKMYLHRGGLAAARSRAGQHDPGGGVKSHLDAHAKAIGMGDGAKSSVEDAANNIAARGRASEKEVKRTMNTIAEFKAESPDLYQQVADAIREEVERDLRASFDAEKKGFEDKVTGLQAQLQERDQEKSKLEERVLKLEKADFIRTEQEKKERIAMAAESIWTKALAGSDVPEHMHEKVRKMVKTDAFTKEDVFDEQAFGQAVQTEIEDWEGKGMTRKVLGTGFSVKSGGVEDPDAKLAQQQEADVDAWVKDMLALGGQIEKGGDK